MTKQHLLVDLSSHGFGHFAQTSMVLNAPKSKREDVIAHNVQEKTKVV